MGGSTACVAGTRGEGTSTVLVQKEDENSSRIIVIINEQDVHDMCRNFSAPYHAIGPTALSLI